MSDKIVVIGSNSFSGSHFIDYVLNSGAEVVGISRSAEPSYVFLPYKSNKNLKRFRFHQFDLNHRLREIMEVINEFRPDYVVNFAAQSMVGESWLYPEHWLMTNVVSNVKFHDLLRKCDFLKKYVHVSTPEVYGTCSGVIREDAPFNPSTPYAVSRAACDMSLLSFFKNYQFPVVFTRAANVYGPGQQLYRIIPKTIISIKTGTRLELHGGGQSVRSFIHIRDVAEGTMKVARNAPSGEVYHLSTEKYISIRELVENICRKMEVQYDEVVQVVGERQGKDAAYLLDSTKAKEQLGWTAKVKLDEGIDETIKWVNENFEEIVKQPSKYVHKP